MCPFSLEELARSIRLMVIIRRNVENVWLFSRKYHWLLFSNVELCLLLAAVKHEERIFFLRYEIQAKECTLLEIICRNACSWTNSYISRNVFSWLEKYAEVFALSYWFFLIVRTFGNVSHYLIEQIFTYVCSFPFWGLLWSDESDETCAHLIIGWLYGEKKFSLIGRIFRDMMHFSDCLKSQKHVLLSNRKNIGYFHYSHILRKYAYIYGISLDYYAEKCKEMVGKLDYSVVCRNVCSFLIRCTGEMCHTLSVPRFNQNRGNVKKFTFKNYTIKRLPNIQK